VKEKDIESKLSQIVAEWTVQTLQFSSFKMRGELLLKGVETQDIVTLMEDSLMMLSSLLSNRYFKLHSITGTNTIIPLFSANSDHT